MFRSCILLACFILITYGLTAYGQDSSSRIVLETSTILDGTGGTLKGQRIVVNGSRIEPVGAGSGKITYDLFRRALLCRLDP